jgi:hypothetical protein
VTQGMAAIRPGWCGAMVWEVLGHGGVVKGKIGRLERLVVWKAVLVFISPLWRWLRPCHVSRIGCRSSDARPTWSFLGQACFHEVFQTGSMCRLALCFVLLEVCVLKLVCCSSSLHVACNMYG